MTAAQKQNANTALSMCIRATTITPDSCNQHHTTSKQSPQANTHLTTACYGFMHLFPLAAADQHINLPGLGVKAHVCWITPSDCTAAP